MKPIKIETNPRWEKAAIEVMFLSHTNENPYRSVPLRYETREDFLHGRAIPPYLKIHTNGHIEETW